MILTKGDLLSLDDLASCKALIEDDLHIYTHPNDSNSMIADNDCLTIQELSVNPSINIEVISCNTGAGVHHLWNVIKGIVYTQSVPIGGHHSDNTHVVREHKNANILRYPI